jgi:hypothetical protein
VNEHWTCFVSKSKVQISFCFSFKI